MSYLSRVQYTGTGSTALYSIPFAYISKAYIEVRVGGSLLTEGVGFSWQSPTSILLLGGNLATGVVLDIRRATPKTSKLVDFQDGSVLTEAALDLANDQVFQMSQETVDDMTDRIAVQPDGTVDAQNRRIKNVADPLNAQDAATKVYVDATLPASVAAAAGSASAASGSAASAAGSATSALASKNAAAVSETNAAASAAEAVAATPGSVKVSASDTSLDRLSNKIAVSGGLTKATLNAGGNEQLQLTAPVSSVMGRTGAVVLGSGDVTGALGYTPQTNLGYNPVQQGTGIGQGANTVKLGWGSSRLKCTVDATDLGAFVFDNSSGAIRAWSQFDGNGNLNSAYGISGASRASTGNIWVNLSPALSNANYAVAGTTQNGASNSGYIRILSKGTGSFNIGTINGTGSAYEDCSYVSVIVAGI